MKQCSILTIVYSLLWSVSISVEYIETIEFIVYSDNSSILESLSWNYWQYNVWEVLIVDLNGYDWIWGDDDWPVVEDHDNYKDLALVVTSGDLKWKDSTNYENARTLLNNFNPNDVQSYMAKYIPSTMMFNVKGASTAIPGTNGTQYQFNFNECPTENPSKVYLTALCAVTSADKNNIYDNWKWDDIWGTYIFPNSQYLGGYSATGTSDRNIVTVSFDGGYISYDDFVLDYNYNNMNITDTQMTKTLYKYYPRMSNITDITIECDILTTVCLNSNCMYNLPWQNQCNSTDYISTTTSSPYQYHTTSSDSTITELGTSSTSHLSNGVNTVSFRFTIITFIFVFCIYA